VNFQAIALGYFVAFSMVYSYTKESLYWDVGFFASLYFLVVVLILPYAKNARTFPRRLFFWIMIIYFSTLTVMNVICLINAELYAPLISETGSVTIPFAVSIVLLGLFKIYTSIRKT
jgi:hypothetical protein